MRTSAIDALFPETRKNILAATLMQPQCWWYLSDLAHHLGVTRSSLQRELASLSQAGILRQKRDGNRVYYRPDPDCPFLPELTGLMVKTAGVLDVLRDTLTPFAHAIMVAFVYGSLARSEEQSASDVDLMVIGEVGLSDLSPALRTAEERLGRAVNPSVYTPAEFAKKLRAGHHFLENVLRQEKLFVLGGDGELAEARKSRKATRYKPKRAR